jgi:flagellar assembly protein FliH
VDLNAAAERLFGEARAERLKAHADSQTLIADAKAEVAETIAEAKRRIDEAGETIYTLQEARRFLAEQEAKVEAAREEGRSEGHAQGLAEVAGHLEIAMQMAMQARVDRAQLIAEAEPDVVGVAVEVARKIIHSEVQARPEIMHGLVSEALKRVTAQDGIRVRIHPDTIRLLGDTLRQVAVSYANRGLEIVPDASIERIGLVVETRRGTVDGRLETQLERVSSAFSGLTGVTIDDGGGSR